MKKLKLGFLKILCIMLCAVLLFGCGKGVDGKENGDGPDVLLRGGQLLPCGGRFFPNTLFAINAMSYKQELAGDFLRFAFSYDIQKRGVGGYPLHKKALEDCAAWDFSDHVLSSGDIVLEYASAKENAEMIAYVRKVDQPFMADAIVYEIMEEEAMGYLAGKCGLAESVNAVAGKIQLYLYEQ